MADQAREDRFVEALTRLGGRAGKGRRRKALGWDEATYKALKDDLVAKGVVTPGGGCSGSVDEAEAQLSERHDD